MFWHPLVDNSGQDARFLGRRADHEFFQTGRTAAALPLYERAYRAAVAASDSTFQRLFLNNIGACQLALFRYKDAERTLLKVRESAEAAGDKMLIGSADSNLAAAYAQMDDLTAAETYARESVNVYAGTRKKKQSARAMATLAVILTRKKLTSEGENYFRSGIDTAIQSRDWASASDGWLHYGKVLMENNRLDDAQRALEESRTLLSKSGRSRGQDAVLWNLSRLLLRRQDFQRALVTVNSAIQAATSEGGRIPEWRLYETRAESELALGDARAALRDARTALQWARILRANIIPDNDKRVGIEGVLNEEFSVLIDAGNSLYLQTRDPQLIRETFEASEENRAESLEALLPAVSNWRTRLATPAYRLKLSQLVAEQRRALLLKSAAVTERVNRIQAELSQMESNAGAALHTDAGTVLDRVRHTLPPGASLLSFRLGNRASWLWSFDHGSLHLYRLPPKAVLQGEITDFEAAIRSNDTELIRATGQKLYRHLFGDSRRSYQASSRWYLSVDEPLYTLPFSALTTGGSKSSDTTEFLTQRVSLQILAGAQLLAAPENRRFASSRFLLAGDGVYNRADPRYAASAFFRPAAWSMPRLPASGAEVRFAADLSPYRALLTGAELSKESLMRELDRDPDVIHIASHVIEGQDRWGGGILALGLDGDGEPDLLTPREISLHPLHSRLVIMTGCSSASGEVVPASGLMGLTRAWLAAGAGEVLATQWPTTDESVDGLVGSFYVHLLSSPDGNIPEALRRARQDMISRGGWRAEPRYWSSFFLIGVR